MKASAEEDDGCHVFHCDACGFESHGEAVGRGGGGYDGERRLTVAAVESLHEIGLLGLGGEAGGGSAALHVDNHERQLGDDGETDAFALRGRGRGLRWR